MNTYDLKYQFEPGVILTYRAEGSTQQTIYGTETREAPVQNVSLSLMVKTLYQDRGGNFHILFTSLPDRVTSGEKEYVPPQPHHIYARLDSKGRVLESTDAVNIYIYPFPDGPMTPGMQWQREEHIRPADRIEPLLVATDYTFLQICELNGIPHLQITFNAPRVWYQSEMEGAAGSTAAFSRQGTLYYDPGLGQITRVDQQSFFSVENDMMRAETSFQSVMMLGEVMEDPTCLPAT